MGTASPGTVIVVACFSTGQFFVPRLHSRGFRLVHVVDSEIHSPHVTPLLDDVRERYGEIFDDWIVWDKNIPQNISLLESYDPVAVIAGAEPGVELADKLADLLHLPGNRVETSAVRRDKVRMQQALVDAGVPAMQFFEAGSLDDLLAWTDDHGRWPVIVKPVKSAGTQGVHTCRNREEVIAAWNALWSRSDLFGKTNSTVLVEEYLTGTEYVVNTVSYKGRHFLSDFWVYRKIQVPGVAPIYDYCRLLPHPGSQDPENALVDYAFRVLDALEIRHGPAHTELMLTPDGPRLIETGARVMGGALDPDILTGCIGHNQVDWTIDCHLSPETFLREAGDAYMIRDHLMMKLLISHRSGKVRDLPLINLLSELPSAHSGDLVHVIESGVIERTVDMITIPGIIVLRHPDEAVLIADYRTISDLEDGYDDRLYELETDTLPLYSAGERWVGLSGGLRLPDGLHCRAGADLIWRALDLGPGDDLLECPCQDGRTAMYLARKGACLVGVDPDPVNISRARRRFAANDLPGEFLDLDPEKIHFSRRFDAIVNRGNHSGSFRPRERRALLEKFSRALKPGGRLFIEVLLQGETEKNRYHRRKSPLRSRDAMAGYRVLPQSHGNPAALNMPRKTLQEWRITLRASGLRDVTILGGGDASGLIPECRLIIIAHKP